MGAWVRITQVDIGRTLFDRMYADNQEGGEDNIGARGTNFHTRIAEISGTTVKLERTLPIDIDLSWSPDVRPVTASVEEVGIEHLTIEFSLTQYPEHFDELGFNAIQLQEISNSWVHDIEILNADYGVNLLIGFDFRTTFRHDLTNEWYATGVVFTKGRGDNLRMDHHRAAPYYTLWTEIDCGEGSVPFESGGRKDRGAHTAAYDTLWNVRADNAMEPPEDDVCRFSNRCQRAHITLRLVARDDRTRPTRTR